MQLNKLILSTVLMLAAPFAIADTSEQPALIDAAVGSCAMFNDVGEMVYTNDTKITVTNNPNSMTTHLNCKFETSPTMSGKVWKMNGFYCITFNPDVGMMMTMDSHIRQTRKGDMSLNCHFAMDE